MTIGRPYSRNADSCFEERTTNHIHLPTWVLESSNFKKTSLTPIRKKLKTSYPSNKKWGVN